MKYNLVIMTCMSMEFGKLKLNNYLLTSLNGKNDANFFESNSKQNQQQQQPQTQSSGSRLNDYDSNILENNAYLTISDEMLKIEHRIEILEKMLAKLNTEIDVLQSFGYMVQITDLKHRREKILDELAELNDAYDKLGLSAKISNQIASAMSFTSNKKATVFSKFKAFIIVQILARVSKKFNYSRVMKDLLSKLTNINSSVDELVTMQVPYGEMTSRYEKLTAYLNKANTIHAKISKDMKDIIKDAPQKTSKAAKSSVNDDTRVQSAKIIKPPANNGIKPIL
ncbi:MAG: hypothetical protein Q8876_09710 [Bacillota bacterium]|nr:hypothetical protein [Bacillota bacterium]